MGSLANYEIEPPQPALAMSTVKLLYGSLAQGDTSTAAGLLAEDLEWWFHGPPGCQHMMKVLTGECPIVGFRFAPRSIATAADMVFAEGWEGEHVYWVHVWTVQDGVITQFREYFNTWLTVKDLRRPQMCGTNKLGGPTLVWQSEPQEDGQRSLPGLILAI